MRILVVEDFAPLRTAVVRGLSEAGHAVEGVGDGTAADELLRQERHDLVVLDLMLPGVSGQELLSDLRSRGDRRAVLLMTARDEVTDRIAGLDAGADDYLVKPFDFGELAARVRALERRITVAPDVITIDDLTIDRVRRVVERANRRIKLTATEFTLLSMLANRAGSVVAREEIHRVLYGEDSVGASSNIVDVYIGYLRRKIDLPGQSPLIHTRRGHGYSLGAEE